MKKLMLAILAVLLVSPAFAGGWGLGLRGGFGESDPKTMKDAYDAYGGNKEETLASFGFMGIEGLYEFDLNDSANKLGVKVGLDIYGEDEWKFSGGKVTEDTFAIPVTVYYKRDGGVQAFSWYAGAGMTYIKTEYEEPGYKTNEDKFFPHVLAGVEYRFCRLFALGLEGKYNINAKLEKDNFVFSDHSGLSGAIVAKFYF